MMNRKQFQRFEVLFLFIFSYFFTRQKCYRLVELPLAFYDAERYCMSSLGTIGTTGTHLVHIGDRTENELLYRVCRGRK
jgi:hypothetical protein